MIYKISKASKVIISTAVLSTTYMYNKNRNDKILWGKSQQKQMLPKHRPNDWLHIFYAVQVYQKQGSISEPDWEVIDTHYEEETSYFGAAYCDNNNKHIIIAHRGTEDLRDWMTNCDLITRHLNQQEVNAWDDFAKKIITKYGSDYSYSFTGHSLGGWLAQTCLWKYQDEFINNQPNAYKDGFAVTLDDPGARELLEALQPRTENNYKIAIDQLDITAYLSRPNIVNTALGHVGSTYALTTKNNDLSWWERNITYTINMHNAHMLLNEFDEKTGLPKHCLRIIDWPQVIWGISIPSANNKNTLVNYLARMFKACFKGELDRSEYNGFYNYDTNVVDNVECLTAVSQFQLRHGIHYNIKKFDEQVLPLRNMPFSMQEFLKDLGAWPDRLKVIRLITGSQTADEFAQALSEYKINKRNELILDQNKVTMTARKFRDQLLSFLTKHPQLYQNKLTVLISEQNLRVAQTNSFIIENLYEQFQYNKDLLYSLSFQQGTAKLYRFIKPSYDEVKKVRNEQHAVDKQLDNLQLLNASLSKQQIPLSIKHLLEKQEQLLQIAYQSTTILLDYMEERYERADRMASNFIDKLKTPTLDLSCKDIFLNRAYNIKAKIATLQDRKDIAVQLYEEAIKILPKDVLTYSNYASLLIDNGRAEENALLYLQAYKYYKNIDPKQIIYDQLPIICSSMAYGLILLAQSIEGKQINKEQIKLPSVTELRSQARNLLKNAMETNSRYLNARLFSAILYYDEQKYSSALQEINNVLSMQPVHPTALMRKGFILEKLKKPREAIEFLNCAKEELSGTKSFQNKNFIKEIDTRIKIINRPQTRLVCTLM